MNSDFLSPDEEIRRVAEEIQGLRNELQAIGAGLGRIERRLKVAFPNYPKPKPKSKPNRDTSAPAPPKSAEELNRIFSALREATKVEGDVGFAKEVEKLVEEDLVALAYELGISDSKRIGAKKAREGIRKRVQESLLLSGT